MIKKEAMYRPIRAGIVHVLKFLVYSTLFSAFTVTCLTAAMMVLLRIPVDPLLLLMAFTGTMLIYSLNRNTDRHEDRINLPERSEFSRLYGWYFLALSIPLFGIILIFAASRSISVLLVVLMTLAIGILYSPFRIKRIFLLKNLAIGLGVSASLFIVVAMYPSPPSLWLPLFFIILTSVFVNTIVFDIKDIPGDTSAGIRTLPVTRGIQWARGFCGLLLAGLIFLAIPLILIDGIFWALVPFFLYKGLYIALLPVEGTASWWYYGLFVDGEFIVLFLFSIFFSW